MRPQTARHSAFCIFVLLVTTTACSEAPGARGAVRAPSVTASAASPSQHSGGGFALDASARSAPTTAYSGSLPDRVDLNSFNPPVADQGSEAMCTAWATGYYLRGWYAKRDGYYPPTGFSADFTYDQAPHTADGSTSFADNLQTQMTEGLDTIGDFHMSGDATSPVSDADITNAARYKIASYSVVGNPGGSQAFAAYIKQTLAAQTPLAIGVETSRGFDQLNAQSASNLVTDTSSQTGRHALFAYGYDQDGLLVENEWGTDWGYNGYAVLSWAYVESFGLEVVTISPRVPTAPAWQRLPGSASAISVGADGSVWALGVEHVTGGYDIYHWDARAWTWRAVPGGATRLAVDPGGNPWIVNNAGNILHWDGATWQQRPGVARDVAINQYGDLWMISGSYITRLQCPLSGCGADERLVAETGTGVTPHPMTCVPSRCDGNIYSWTNGAWQQIPGAANRIAVDSSDNPWVVNSSGVVSYYMQQVCILCYPTPTPTPTDWTPLPPPKAQALAIANPGDSPRDEVWAIGTDGSVLSWNWATNLWDFTQDVAPAVAIAASPGGSPWVVNADGAIYELPAWNDQ